MEENFRIGIIGGAGKMGRLFQNFFQKKGYEVLICDKEGLSYEELMENSKVVILSLPLDVFPEVVKKIAPRVKNTHWIMDICSLKLEPARVMKKFLIKGELIAAHPLFGPFEKDLKGKRLAYYPLRGKKFLKWLLPLLEEEGIRTIKISPKRHDEIMALVQVLNHFMQVLVAQTIKKTGFSINEIFSLSTPSFLKQLEILKRFAHQDENLYAHIQLDNPFGKKIRQIFCRTCKSLNRALKKEDKESFKIFVENFLIAKDLAKELENLFALEEKEQD